MPVPTTVAMRMPSSATTVGVTGTGSYSNNDVTDDGHLLDSTTVRAACSRILMRELRAIVTVAGDDSTIRDGQQPQHHDPRHVDCDGSFATEIFAISVTDVNESGVTAVSDSDAAADFVLENSAPGSVSRA